MTPEDRKLAASVRGLVKRLQDQWNVVAESGNMNPKLLNTAIEVITISILTRVAVGATVPGAVVDFVNMRRGGTLAKANMAIDQAVQSGYAQAVLFLRDEVTLLHDLRKLAKAMNSGHGRVRDIIRVSLRVGELMPIVFSWHSGRTIALMRQHSRQSESGRLSRKISDEDLHRARQIFDEAMPKSNSRSSAMVIVAARLSKEGISVSPRTLARHLAEGQHLDVEHRTAQRLWARIKGLDNS